ncbi:cis-prenyltransferase 4, chloroplastic [Beta vulgaris subsp. vulgaris]|uniref:cis-prenyltransferase 4, chloroplastic n=1 Tax=Beta vulgaris subsp. vulgaris TaxID=3555 RepID=UPI002037443B|nr:cis-prenyltransferase 4, chloroplastic [Beta vulgaris subsp. vulgaris]
MLSRFILPQTISSLSISAHNLSPKLKFLNHHLVGPTSSFRAHSFLFTTSAENESVAKDERNVGNSSATDFPAELRRELMPGHVAMILDGNKRWAELRGLESIVGHDAGLKALLEVMGLCCKWAIKVATFFLFSSENWRRPKAEIEFVMWRFQKMLEDELENIIRQGIRISTIGDISLLPISLQEVIEHTKEATKDNTKTHVIFAISYSGKNDIVQACKNISTKVRNGLIEPDDVTETLIEQELETKITSTPCPDLLIRTSGELRISNFLLWQLAYSEFYFTKTLWPDFGEPEFIEALQSFQKRGRRFGGRL